MAQNPGRCKIWEALFLRAFGMYKKCVKLQKMQNAGA